MKIQNKTTQIEFKDAEPGDVVRIGGELWLVMVGDEEVNAIRMSDGVRGWNSPDEDCRLVPGEFVAFA